MIRHSNRELWLAFIAILGITLLYAFVLISWREIPGASGFFGHMLGILGFILMLMTEILYSMRKRRRDARWGRMADWLQFHIFTGIVGPYMVLLHSSWKFNGIAGILCLFTFIVVLSGFIGRYIYTAVPRTADGIEYEAGEIEKEIGSLQDEIEIWLAGQSDQGRSFVRKLASIITPPSGIFRLNIFHGISEQINWWLYSRNLTPILRQSANDLRRILKRRELLRSQLQSMAMARRILAIWHAIHIPIGMALFTAAFVHIGAAIYYATLLK